MNKSDLSRNAYMLPTKMSKKGYMRWWHSFTGIQPENGEQRVFFVEYMIVNPASHSTVPILGQLKSHKKKGIRPSYVLVKAGAFGNGYAQATQLHNFYPVSDLQVAQSPLVMQIQDNFYSENRICGFVEVTGEDAGRKAFMCGEGYMEWDLEVHKAIAGHTGFIANPFFCALNALETFWHGEGIQSFYRGHVSLDGITYEVTPDTCYGYADKHWGRSFNKPWLQIASSHFTSEKTGRELKHCALAVEGCCPRFLCFPRKQKLYMQLTYGGEDLEFHFTGLRTRSRTKWSLKNTRSKVVWRLVARNKEYVVKISLQCPTQEMLSVNYESPVGSRPAGLLLGGGTGIGTVLIYRVSQEGISQKGKELLDTLTMENVFCQFEVGPF